jgi:hypothetical protein
MSPLIGVSLNIGSHIWYARQVLAERAAAAAAGYRIEVRDAEDDPAGRTGQRGPDGPLQSLSISSPRMGLTPCLPSQHRRSDAYARAALGGGCDGPLLS